MGNLFWKIVSDNWGIILMAPALFVGAILFGWISGWAVIRLVYNQRLAHQADMITNLRAVLEEKLPASFLPPQTIKQSRQMSLGFVFIFAGAAVVIVGAALVLFNKSASHSIAQGAMQFEQQPQTPNPYSHLFPDPAKMKSALKANQYYSVADKEALATAMAKISLLLKKDTQPVIDKFQFAAGRTGPISRLNRPIFKEELSSKISDLDDGQRLLSNLNAELWGKTIQENSNYSAELNDILASGQSVFGKLSTAVAQLSDSYSTFVMVYETIAQQSKIDEWYGKSLPQRSALANAGTDFRIWTDESLGKIEATRIALK